MKEFDNKKYEADMDALFETKKRSTSDPSLLDFKYGVEDDKSKDAIV